MSTNSTEQEFSKHVGTQFETFLEDRKINLMLAEVKAYMPQESEEGGMERFSVFFDGPGELFLPQQTYLMLATVADKVVEQ